MGEREKLLKLLLEHCDYKGQIDCKEDCERCLADHLIANGVVVREKGEWEWYDLTISQSCINRGYMCSACGFKQEVETNFCPNCGADMTGGDRNE